MTLFFQRIFSKLVIQICLLKAIPRSSVRAVGQLILGIFVYDTDSKSNGHGPTLTIPLLQVDPLVRQLLSRIPNLWIKHSICSWITVELKWINSYEEQVPISMDKLLFLPGRNFLATKIDSSKNSAQGWFLLIAVWTFRSISIQIDQNKWSPFCWVQAQHPSSPQRPCQ